MATNFGVKTIALTFQNGLKDRNADVKKITWQ